MGPRFMALASTARYRSLRRTKKKSQSESRLLDSMVTQLWKHTCVPSGQNDSLKWHTKYKSKGNGLRLLLQKLVFFSSHRQHSHTWSCDSLRPAFKGRHGEQSQHAHQHVVKVEIAVLPDPLLHHGVVHVSIFIDHKCSPKNKTGAYVCKESVPRELVHFYGRR